ncbi:hypothetical protein Bca52824_056675 [Brassica carinata]|uniref:Serine aminopeptidase S33 domain-containing protein n=2 Tax=Brassica TaxID=3705 RepID=A0A8X7QTC7_BRACI|nr:hypothetical protein Bca52824_056675 [Brassica carinata]
MVGVTGVVQASPSGISPPMGNGHLPTKNEDESARVKHLLTAIAPIFSLVAPRFQFKGANKRGIPVSRDPEALLAKYSDPLVYTGPIRVRTGHEILRITGYLTRNFKSITVPFFVLHGTEDKVTDPLASQDLYNQAPSVFKDIKLYEGFLHDLLFEPEREEVGRDIIDWMMKRLDDVIGSSAGLW